MSSKLEREVARVVKNDNCSGCGGCSLISSRITMTEQAGYMRPSFNGVPDNSEAVEARQFTQICPGSRLRAPLSEGETHPTFGRYVSVWRAHATDKEIRFEGSSAGVISALSAYALSSGHASSVAASGASPTRPLVTIPIRAVTRSDVVRASGSRYAPVSALDPRIDESTVVVGKPCEISALRRFRTENEPGADHPITLSFFCAGVPSQTATEDLVTGFGVELEDVKELRYRGRGWPGHFRVATQSATHEMTYEQSWGAHLGKNLQWRCKICPDGTGADADIAVGDYWDSDDRGFPIFTDADGISVAIARTVKGHEFLMRAAADGVVSLEPLNLNEVAKVQPLQVKRKQVLLGRMLGRRLAGKTIPRYSGYGLLAAVRQWPKANFAAAKGSFTRSLPTGLRHLVKSALRRMRKSAE